MLYAGIHNIKNIKKNKKRKSNSTLCKNEGKVIVKSIKPHEQWLRDDK